MNGNSVGFNSLVKSTLLKYFIMDNQKLNDIYMLVSATYIIDTWLGKTDTNLSYLIDLPFLFINLTQFIHNNSLGEVLLYLFSQRTLNKLPTWFFTNCMKAHQLDEEYSTAFKDTINLLPKLDIDKLSTIANKHFIKAQGK